jgi:hypothetical protein
MNTPSITEPSRLKYQLIEFNVCDEQPKDGVYWKNPVKRENLRDD